MPTLWEALTGPSKGTAQYGNTDSTLGKVYRNWKQNHDAVYNARQAKSKAQSDAAALAYNQRQRAKMAAEEARIAQGLSPNPTMGEYLSELGNDMQGGGEALINDLNFGSGSFSGIDVTPSYKNKTAVAGLGTPGGYGGAGTRRVPQINPTVSVPATVAPATQSAPDYNSMSFGQAFNAARKAGLSEFSWRDKGRFNTRLDTEENPVQVAAQAPVTPMEQAPVEVPVPVQAAPAMQRQPVATGYGSGLPSGNALVQGDPRLREMYARIRAENAAKQAATAMASGL